MCKSRTTFKALQLKLMLVFFFLKKKIYHFMEIGILWLFHIKYPQWLYINVLKVYGQQVGKASSRRPSEAG